MDIGPSKTSPVVARPNSALKRLRLAAAITAGLALLAGAGQWVYRHFTHVIVDDARIAADMIALASRVPGWVMELPVIAGDEPRQGALLIDDTYNANPDSVRAAIDVLARAPGRKLLVLGDMGEVGDQGPQFHAEVGEHARARGIDALLTLGEQSRAMGGVAGGTYLFALPGSTGACKDGWDEILRFQLDSRHRPCNLVELMPRLLEHLKPL